MKRYSLPLLISAFISQGCSLQHTDVVKESVSHQGHAQDKTNICTDQTEPSIACSKTVSATLDKIGRLWLAWVDNDHVYVQSSSDKGQTFSEPVMVNAVAEPIIAHDEYRPKIQLDRQGNIYLTWTRSLEKRHTGHIRFSRSLDGGKSFSEPVTVNDNQDIISHRFDDLLVGENGEVWIAWLDARDKVDAKSKGTEFLGTSLYYAWSDNRGQSFYPNQVVAAHTCECCRLGASLDNDGLPVVIWRAVFPGQIRDHALVKFQNWQTPGSLKRLSAENWSIDACPHHGPALAIADDGSYHAVWFSGAESKQGLFYAYSSDQGNAYSQPMSFGSSGAKHPHLAVQGRQVAIAWLEFDGSNTLVKVMRSSDGGKHWSEPKLLGASPDAADYAFLIGDDRRIYLSWQNRQGYQFRPVE